MVLRRAKPSEGWLVGFKPLLMQFLGAKINKKLCICKKCGDKCFRFKGSKVQRFKMLNLSLMECSKCIYIIYIL